MLSVTASRKSVSALNDERTSQMESSIASRWFFRATVTSARGVTVLIVKREKRRQCLAIKSATARGYLGQAVH